MKILFHLNQIAQYINLIINHVDNMLLIIIIVKLLYVVKLSNKANV